MEDKGFRPHTVEGFTIAIADYRRLEENHDRLAPWFFAVPAAMLAGLATSQFFNLPRPPWVNTALGIGVVPILIVVQALYSANEAARIRARGRAILYEYALACNTSVQNNTKLPTPVWK